MWKIVAKGPGRPQEDRHSICEMSALKTLSLVATCHRRKQTLEKRWGPNTVPEPLYGNIVRDSLGVPATSFQYACWCVIYLTWPKCWYNNIFYFQSWLFRFPLLILGNSLHSSVWHIWRLQHYLSTGYLHPPCNCGWHKRSTIQWYLKDISLHAAHLLSNTVSCHLL